MPDVYVNGFIQPFVNGTTAAGIKVNNTYVLQADANGVTVRPEINGRVTLRPIVGGTTNGGVYLGNVTPSSSNYSISGDGSNLSLNAPGSGAAIGVRVTNVEVYAVRDWGIYWQLSKSAPADGNLGNSTGTIWWDGTNLKWKKKDAGGVVTTGNVF